MPFVLVWKILLLYIMEAIHASICTGKHFLFWWKLHLFLWFTSLLVHECWNGLHVIEILLSAFSSVFFQWFLWHHCLWLGMNWCIEKTSLGGQLALIANVFSGSYIFRCQMFFYSRIFSVENIFRENNLFFGKWLCSKSLESISWHLAYI